MTGIVIAEVIIVLAVALLSVIWVLTKGPSPAAQRLFVMSVKETSAAGWLANIFLDEEKVENILSYRDTGTGLTKTDTSLISIPAFGHAQYASYYSYDPDNDADNSPADSLSADTAQTDAGTDPDGDGLELVEIKGNGYSGYMLIIDDPMRIFLDTPSRYGGSGLRLGTMVERNDAVAGINGGGFVDPRGSGHGGTPRGVIIVDGNLKWDSGGASTIIGFDADGILHVGYMSAKTAVDLGIQWACSFGPVLIKNGEPISSDVLGYSYNPRTAIGQRADGTVLMLVIDGRRIGSIGASLPDLIEIFLEFDAVNAANLDGGFSTQMILYGETVNSPSFILGDRALPSAFLVREKQN